MSDLTNFYQLLPKDKQKLPIGYKSHMIDKNSRILMIGSSGTGKSNSLLNFIENHQENSVRLSYVVFQLLMNLYITFYSRRSQKFN